LLAISTDEIDGEIVPCGVRVESVDLDREWLAEFGAVGQRRHRLIVGRRTVQGS
jgi:hypothetical protein